MVVARTQKSWAQENMCGRTLWDLNGVHDLSDNVADGNSASRAKDMVITFQEIASGHPGSVPPLVGRGALSGNITFWN